ncbi:hypothetical protein [Microbacterium sp. SLBN-146]|uniref:hypothetical protein n=1 Tax=Microbacterium sp. SLBN-146 TaxID=2768457 RepID=UPI00116A5FA3|nr:hypothetical protein [Microbacterium sp. SLBN-146]TQJ29868.1 hypothetical protein FBY39_0311 [Microbacterium sp. SLBN-146]
MAHPLVRRSAAAVLVVVLVLFAPACGIPRDPDRTLDRVTGATLRVGASPHEGLVIVDDGVVSGSLATLIEGFADDRDAEIEWTVDSEEGLVDRLERGSLDLAIGGMTDATPWGDRVSVTRGYPDLAGSAGSNIVVLLPMGENALQAALETYLDREARP